MDPFFGSFKIVRNWTENKINTQLTDMIKPEPLAGKVLLITSTYIHQPVGTQTFSSTLILPFIFFMWVG